MRIDSGILNRKSIGYCLTIAFSVLMFASPPALSTDDRRPHNQAEGDNPALDEAVIQGAKKNEDDKKKEGGQQSNQSVESDKAQSAAENARAENARAENAEAPPDWSKLSSVVEKLVIEFYPKAKIKRGTDQIHVEYKSKPYEIASTNKIEIGPDWSGIVFDIQLKQGPYVGVDVVPKKFNEYSFYHVELFAPYSKKYDRHLLTRISYPFDVPPDFLKRFKNLVDKFDQCL